MKKSSGFLFIIAILCGALAYLEFSGATENPQEEPNVLASLSDVRDETDELLRAIELTTQDLVAELEKGSMFPEDLDYLLKELPIKNDKLWEIEAAFEPYQFDSDMELMGRGYNADLDSLFTIPELYNYRDTFEIRAKWYVNTMIYNLPYWSKPYMDNNGLNIDLIYPVFYRAGIVAEQLIGVVRVKSLFPLSKLEGLQVFDDKVEDVFDANLQTALGLNSILEISDSVGRESLESIAGATEGEILVEPDPKSVFSYVRSNVLGWVFGKLSVEQPEVERDRTWFFVYLVGGLLALLLALASVRRKQSH